MGFFDGRPDSDKETRRSSTHQKSHSSPRFISASSSGQHKQNYSGIFGSSAGHEQNKSTTSFFSFGGKSSHRRASPRAGYLNRLYKQLRRLLRDLLYYFKRHPMKVFMLVIVPLISGGALTGLLSKFGIRLPAGLMKMFGGSGLGAEAGGGGRWETTGIGRGSTGDLQFERTRYEGYGGGSSSGLGTALNLAKLFI